MQGKLEEREGEAPGETEVGDGTQRWKARWTRPPVLGRNPSSRLQPPTPSNCREKGKRIHQYPKSESVHNDISPFGNWFHCFCCGMCNQKLIYCVYRADGCLLDERCCCLLHILNSGRLYVFIHPSETKFPLTTCAKKAFYGM